MRSGLGHEHARPGCENSSYLGPPSKELIRIAADIKEHSNAPILDLGCGYGRNAIALAARGFSVVCVDKKNERLNVLARLAPKHIADLRQPQSNSGRLYPLLGDLGPSQWPFRENCFAGMVCVHFLNVALFGVFRSSLVTGGFLYIETFGGHGGNYLDLPKAGQLHRLLRADFDIPFYRERKVGPAAYDAVTVKLFAVKRSPVGPATISPHLWTSGGA
jgi:SAM-dependent methyltransferase